MKMLMNMVLMTMRHDDNDDGHSGSGHGESRVVMRRRMPVMMMFNFVFLCPRLLLACHYCMTNSYDCVFIM